MDCKILSWIGVLSVEALLLSETLAKYVNTFLVVSVLPAPLSPLIKTDWFLEFCFNCFKAIAPVTNTWGYAISPTEIIEFARWSCSFEYILSALKGLTATNIEPTNVYILFSRNLFLTWCSIAPSDNSSKSTKFSIFWSICDPHGITLRSFVILYVTTPLND